MIVVARCDFSILRIRVAIILLFIAILILTGVQVHRLRPKWKFVFHQAFFHFTPFVLKNTLRFNGLDLQNEGRFGQSVGCTYVESD